jgi:hypothetical protein
VLCIVWWRGTGWFCFGSKCNLLDSQLSSPSILLLVYGDIIDVHCQGRTQGGSRTARMSESGGDPGIKIFVKRPQPVEHPTKPTQPEPAASSHPVVARRLSFKAASSADTPAAGTSEAVPVISASRLARLRAGSGLLSPEGNNAPYGGKSNPPSAAFPNYQDQTSSAFCRQQSHPGAMTSNGVSEPSLSVATTWDIQSAAAAELAAVRQAALQEATFRQALMQQAAATQNLLEQQVRGTFMGSHTVKYTYSQRV